MINELFHFFQIIIRASVVFVTLLHSLLLNY